MGVEEIPSIDASHADIRASIATAVAVAREFQHQENLKRTRWQPGDDVHWRVQRMNSSTGALNWLFFHYAFHNTFVGAHFDSLFDTITGRMMIDSPVTIGELADLDGA
ncbi:hypothetical protein PT974_09659 [Cladobotryum mycophilum]|uniref:Uncharacterized protein n=1 Tax=Cladobotryum mycophilum TaxID=491253 RepID=A0ABR0SGS5_9HYPO